jgi:hypothetical protein
LLTDYWEKNDSLRVALDSPCHDLFARKLTITGASISSAAIDEDKESFQGDSAIGDEDWEDSNDEGNSASVGEKTFFERIHSRVNPSPRESLITLAFRSTQHLGPTPQPEHAVLQSAFSDAHRASTPLCSMEYLICFNEIF